MRKINFIVGKSEITKQNWKREQQMKKVYERREKADLKKLAKLENSIKNKIVAAVLRCQGIDKNGESSIDKPIDYTIRLSTNYFSITNLQGLSDEYHVKNIDKLRKYLAAIDRSSILNAVKLELELKLGVNIYLTTRDNAPTYYTAELIQKRN